MNIHKGSSRSMSSTRLQAHTSVPPLVGHPGLLVYVHAVGLPIWYSPDISTLNASRSPPALDEVEKLKASPLELPAEDIQSVPKINKRQQKDLS